MFLAAPENLSSGFGVPFKTRNVMSFLNDITFRFLPSVLSGTPNPEPQTPRGGLEARNLANHWSGRLVTWLMRRTTCSRSDSVLH